MKKITSMLFLLVVYTSYSHIVDSNIGAKNIEYIEGDTSTPTAADYVQDGLVAMWDGIENAGWGVHDDDALAPYELVSGSLEESLLNRCIMGYEYIESKANSSYNTILSMSTARCVINGYVRIEVVAGSEMFQGAVYGNFMQILGGSFGYNHYTGNGGCSMFSSGWVSARDISLIGSDKSILGIEIDSSKNYLQYFVNDVASEQKSIVIPSNIETKFYFSGSHHSKIYSFRVYCRKLSNNEIKHNKTIDKERFGL